MNDLMVFNNPETQSPIELLLEVGEDGRVSSRNVYKFLGHDFANYSRWCRNNITSNEFADEGEDYTRLFIKEEHGQNTTDYRLSVPFAKKLCMLSKTERGEQARDYFILIEDKMKEVATKATALSNNTYATMRLMIDQMERHETELATHRTEITAIKQKEAAREEKLDNALQIFSASSGENWRGAMERQVNALSGGKFSPGVRGKMYAELEESAGVLLDSRLSRLRKRMKKNRGATHREAEAVNKLDVIARDKQLKPIFEGILRKYQARHCMGGQMTLAEN